MGSTGSKVIKSVTVGDVNVYSDVSKQNQPSNDEQKEKPNDGSKTNERKD
jgi:hypothetical protein